MNTITISGGNLSTDNYLELGYGIQRIRERESIMTFRNDLYFSSVA